MFNTNNENIEKVLDVLQKPAWESGYKPLSNCCHAEVKVNTASDGDICPDCRKNTKDCKGGHTNFYVCTACGEACDFQPTPAQEWRERFEQQFVDRPFEPDGDYAWRLGATPINIKLFIADVEAEAEKRGMAKQGNSGRAMYQNGLRDGRQEAIDLIENHIDFLLDKYGDIMDVDLLRENVLDKLKNK